MTESRLVPTGNSVLDTILGGGLPSGALLLVEAQDGAGAPEFALSALRGVVQANTGRSACFATALRAPARVQREITTLFQSDKAASLIDVRPLRQEDAWSGFRDLFSLLKPMDVLAVESTAALARLLPENQLLGAIQMLGNLAAEREVTVILLHATGSLPPLVETGLREACDGVFTFVWREGSTSRRRLLVLSKVRGLTPILDGEEVPVFEVGLHQGTGFTLSRVKNVV